MIIPDAMQALVMPDHPRDYVRHRFAIVRHDPRDTLPDKYAPDTITMQDFPSKAGTGKGAEIPIYPNWWSYLRKINSDKGYSYTRSIGAMWINTWYDQEHPNPQPPAKAVSIIGGGNFVRIDKRLDGWNRLVAFPKDFDTSKLDPAKNNWYQESDSFWYPVAINAAGKMIKTNGGDVFFALIANTELWLHDTQIELLPDGYDYKFRGTDVYDGTDPLMTVSQNRVRRFYRTDWRLDTIGVIPPEGWNE